MPAGELTLLTSCKIKSPFPSTISHVEVFLQFPMLFSVWYSVSFALSGPDPSQ